MQIIELFLTASITMLALGLMILSLLGYRKNHNTKMLFITMVFFVFLIKGLLFTIDLFIEDFTIFASNLNIWFFDLAVLVLLYIASLKGWPYERTL
jgi:hypothetical protein